MKSYLVQAEVWRTLLTKYGPLPRCLYTYLPGQLDFAPHDSYLGDPVLLAHF